MDWTNFGLGNQSSESNPTSSLDLVRDAVRFWEPMRIVYNLILAAWSMVFWGPEIFSGRLVDLIAGVVVLSVFALAANLCYCVAYPIDLVFQLSPMRPYRTLGRGVLFLCGSTLASAIALWVLLGDHMP